MLEGLVAWVLNNYLGKYVENLNTDQLSVALLSGKVEFENLPLKKDALRHLGLPIEVRAGYVGRVQLQVPVRQLRSAPWIIAIEKLYVVAAPVNLDEWDGEVEAQRAYERKVALLDALEAAWRAEHDAADAGYYAASYSGWLAYGTGLLASIVENLQLKLNDVHIRFEDLVTGRGTFACGLTVEALSAESCDSEWRRGVQAAPDACSFKLLELQQLAVYWDPFERPKTEDINKDNMEHMSCTWKRAHRWLLRPATAQARVRRERTEQPLRTRARPRLTCQLTLNTVHAHLTQRQYNEAVLCCVGLERIQRVREFRRLRPWGAVSDAPRAWWRYAAACVVGASEPWPSCMGTTTWSECLAAAAAAQRYADTCLLLLSQPAAALPADRKQDKDDYEWKQPLDVLKALREAAMRRVPQRSVPAPSTDKASSGRSMLVRWFPQWWGWYTPPDQTNQPEGAEAPADRAPLEDELLDVLADSLENNTLLRRDSVFAKFEFLLNTGSLNLCTDTGDSPDCLSSTCSGLELQFTSLRLSVESRPRAGALALLAALGALTLRERLQPRSQYPVLAAAHGAGLALPGAPPRTSEDPLFQLAYERKPVGLNCDYKVWVKTAPLEVVWSGEAVSWMRKFAVVPWGAARGASNAEAQPRTTHTLRTRLEHMLQHTQSERRSWHVELDISAPQLVFPQSLLQRDCSLVLVDFGRLRLCNAHPEDKRSQSTHDDEDEELFMTPCSTPPGSLASPPEPTPPRSTLHAASLRTSLYDRYDIELSELQILVGRGRDNWQYAHGKSSSSLHLVDRFSIGLAAERRVVATQDPQYPAATLCGSLPALGAHVSERKLAALRAVLQAVLPRAPHPPPPPPAPAPEPEELQVPDAAALATMYVVQFAIDQVSLEVQSRGRSVCEVQVAGVRAQAAGRAAAAALALSVHSLLLVDALQTHGPDYELLLSSHKHLGMDAASGSILGSGPASPASPASPDPRPPAPSAPTHALCRALTKHADESEYNSLFTNFANTGPTWPSGGGGGAQWGGGQYGNGLGGASAGWSWPAAGGAPPWTTPGLMDSEALIAIELCWVKGEDDSEDIRIANIMFNNLDIIANQETIVELIGFCQRVMSDGTAPAPPEQPPPAPGDVTDAPVHTASEDEKSKEVRTEITFDFHRLGVLLVRTRRDAAGLPVAQKVAAATASEARIQASIERGCVSATGSLGGVQVVSLLGALHARVLNAGRAVDSAADARAFNFTVTRRAHEQVSLEITAQVSRVVYTHAPALLAALAALAAQFSRYLASLASLARHVASSLTQASQPLLTVTVELESPVVVVPCAAQSTQVLVAHLGRSSVASGPAPAGRARTLVRVRHIALHALDVGEKLRQFGLSAETLPLIYDASDGEPILHDTALDLHLAQEPDKLDFSGEIVGDLHITARRETYEQVLQTVQYVSSSSAATERDEVGGEEPKSLVEVAELVEPAVPTLRLEPKLRAAELAPPPPPPQPAAFTETTVRFEIPTLCVQLRADLGAGERSLVSLTCRELCVTAARTHPHVANTRVTLHSVIMEDLTQPADSRHRMLMVSHTSCRPAKAVFVSASCPELRALRRRPLARALSLPQHLNATVRTTSKQSRQESTCEPSDADGDDEEQSPDSDADEDLVCVSVTTCAPEHPNFETTYSGITKLTKVEFNCLKLVVNVDCWVAVLDFFGVAADDNEDTVDGPPTEELGAEGAAGLSVTEVLVRSLSGVVVGRGGETCRARVSRVRVAARAQAGGRRVRASLAALALTDLTPHAPLWRTRFRTHSLAFRYDRLTPAEALASGHDVRLTATIGPATYVHTARFVHELATFAREFTILRRVIAQARRQVTVGTRRASRTAIDVTCATARVILPVSGRSSAALSADLRKLRLCTLHNECTQQLDVREMSVEGVMLSLAGSRVLPVPAALRLRVELRRDANLDVADMTLVGTLESLQLELDVAQYRVLRGVLAHNLAAPAPPAPPPSPHAQVHRTLSLQLELQDVTLRLRTQRGTALACVNLIRSKLHIDNHSDMGQDIDLVSQEILISDSRYASLAANRRGNVFHRIVQPMPAHAHSVQAELHARKRPDSSAYTILVNNMRLMAILDWWEAFFQFLSQPPLPPADATHTLTLDLVDSTSTPEAVHHTELKLNVTDSQLVLVESAAHWDTNAVILKSTTVLRLGSEASGARQAVCELSELEVFSCVLGLEDETALPIVPRAALTIALRQRQLQVSMGKLEFQLSYHDMKMFAAILKSLPVQFRAALSGSKIESERVEQDVPANMRQRAPRAVVAPRPAPPPPSEPESDWAIHAVKVEAECITLCVIDDCMESDVPLLEIAFSEMKLEQDLRKFDESLEDPKLVTTPMAPPTPPCSPVSLEAESGAVVVASGGGRIDASLAVHYYNRTLGGWEPFVEPWKFNANWEPALTGSLAARRVQAAVTSRHVLLLDVTPALMRLLRQLAHTWPDDCFTPQSGSEQSPKGSPAGYRRRSPFVPYALKNLTGHQLWFTTLLTASDESTAAWSSPDDSWTLVSAGGTEAFSFGRARAHPAPLPQLALRLDGWPPTDPVCAHRQGVYFRTLTHPQSGATAYVVVEVTLEGAARKLVTVRGALTLSNRLPHPVEIRLAPQHAEECSAELAASARAAAAALRLSGARRVPLLPPPPPALHLLVNCGARYSEWKTTVARGGSSVGAGAATVAPGERWAAPVLAAPGALWVRPLLREAPAPGPALLAWRTATDAPATLLHAACPPNAVYRFCCVVTRCALPAAAGAGAGGAAHELTLQPALRVENLLPVELSLRAPPAPPAHLQPASTQALHQVDVQRGVELSVKLEGFGWSSPLLVSAATASFTAHIKLRDSRRRRLALLARVHAADTHALKISISAPYWIVNRSGLPLVYRAEGTADEAAGQFAEHELARVVQPLLLAPPPDQPAALLVRLGRHYPQPQWCAAIPLATGCCARRLVAGGCGAEAARQYSVGVSVRGARGRYRHTTVVTLQPRYQLHNNTPRALQFAQAPPESTPEGGLVSAVAGCWLAWHWARADREPLLCVRVLDANNVPVSAWSGGFRLEAPRALTLSCRGSAGAMLRVELVAQAASVLAVFSDGAQAPPPLRIDNYCPVSLMFHQVGSSEESAVGAHASLGWAAPEPEGAAALALRAPGGPRLTVPLHPVPANYTLLYQNFILIAFVASGNNMSATDQDDVLVLEVPMGSNIVVLGKKRYGDRSQLWRRGPGGALLHEGSSPPQPTDALPPAELHPHAAVLDIEGPGPQPGRAAGLVLRRADPRRASTQAWRLLDAGMSGAARMACAHNNLCVQAAALVPGARALLALPRGSDDALAAVAWHTLRPGSGELSVRLSADGPTRVLTVRDARQPDAGWLECAAEDEDTGGGGAEWALRLALGGLALSLVGEGVGELLHARLTGVAAQGSTGGRRAALAFAVQRLQVDNALRDAAAPVLLHVLERAGGPALTASLQLLRARPAYNALYFEHLVVALRPLAVRLEERLLLALWAWAGGAGAAPAPEPDEAEYETRRVLDELTHLHATRYYFALIQIIPSQIRLSMITSSKLDRNLASLRRRLGLTLVRFEDACVELEPFVRAHAFDTAPLLAHQMLQHFRDELKWQAAKILGSVDFLGNPLGFVADVSEGVSGLLLEGNVGALVSGVTHGLSNSAAKVSAALGDGLERVVADDAHEETRRRIRSSAAGAHLAAGLRGLGLGLLGGMTSLVKHSYEGATSEGLPGFLAGVGKGLVGTVTKPVIGVLDLAAETAAALRDSSARGPRDEPQRMRPPRAVLAGGLLTCYDPQLAEGAELLHVLTGGGGNGVGAEALLAYRSVRGAPHDIRALVSDACLRIVTCRHAAPQVVMETPLSQLVSATAVTANGAHLVELAVRGADGVRRPRVQCDSAALASWLAHAAALARRLHHARAHTLPQTAPLTPDL